MKTDKLLKAEETYFATQGRASYSELAHLVNVNKRTIVRWAKKYHWRARVAELAALVNEKVSEKLAESLADRAAALAESSLQPLERISELVSARLKDPTLDTEQLKPSDLRALALAQDSVIKNARLISGESTSHEQISGKVSLDIETPGYIDEVIQKIIKTGDPEGQLQLLRLQEALQALIESP